MEFPFEVIKCFIIVCRLLHISVNILKTPTQNELQVFTQRIVWHVSHISIKLLKNSQLIQISLYNKSKKVLTFSLSNAKQ